jgi:cold shock CspA family protein
MRLEGTLRSWNDEKGFGFIAPRDGGREIFAHISSFARDGSRPTVGESLSYELGRGKDGKPQAINITRKAIGQRPPQRAPTTQTKSRTSLAGNIMAGLFVLCLAAVAFKFVQGHVKRHELEHQAPQPLVTPTATPAPTISRKCDGRTHCSQMTSCAEATWFINNCPGTQMDGNRDGTPCEQQWCTSPFAK